MKYIPSIAGALLGLLFVVFSAMFLLNLVPEQPAPPEGSGVAHFMAALAPTGYLTAIKCLEMLGGILVAIPKTRNWGLLVLGPIILNILAFHHWVAGDGVFQPVLMLISALALYLLWDGRRKFLGLLN